jgi:hypothetical protein
MISNNAEGIPQLARRAIITLPHANHHLPEGQSSLRRKANHHFAARRIIT